MKAKLLKYAIKNILRNKFLSLSTVLVLSLLMFFVNILAVVHNVSFGVIDKINSKLTISLYLKDNITDKSSGVIDLKNKIKKLSDEIDIEYISKDDALKSLLEKSPNDFGAILEGENPLPGVLELSNIGVEEHSKINEIINQKLEILEGSKQEGGHQGQFDTIKTITPILQNFQIGIYIFLGVFIFSIGVIIYSIISNFIFFFKDEIYITNLVGGGRNFVYGPFMLQGAIYAILALILGEIIFYLFINNIDALFIDAGANFIKINNSYYILLFLGEVLVFSLLGAISGYFSSRKYIKTL
ncbi:MAG: permease-like cell division protein FtsX [Candidatus Gracilibacteria bacterium]|nr:permease-like cell division protein FtsX [Candidatus Gracilibacteria bacterium]